MLRSQSSYHGLKRVNTSDIESKNMLELLQSGLMNQGLTESLSFYGARTITLTGTLALAIIAGFIAKRYIVVAINYLLSLISKSRAKWHEALLRQKVLTRLARLVPVVVVYDLIPVALEGHDALISIIRSGLLIYMVILMVLVLSALLNSAEDAYKNYRGIKAAPIKGLIQALKIVLYFLATVFIVSLLLNKTPIYLLSGIGALAAIMMLVFRDAILGFVAGIQLAANKMIAVGDWIEIPKYGADGDVLEVALTTVKVQNWDKTITTIPTYTLISESFKNWRGMSDSEGRRIKRSLNIDMNSIRFCDEEMLKRFAKIQYISAYVETKKRELQDFNQSKKIDNVSLVNGRRMTNVGTFRAYIVAYLDNHPMVNRDMTCIVRQLPSTEHGLPIEIYVFSKDKEWASYEAIQADIFDHLLAVVKEFDLRIYQSPTGSDFRNTLISR